MKKQLYRLDYFFNYSNYLSYSSEPILKLICSFSSSDCDLSYTINSSILHICVTSYSLHSLNFVKSQIDFNLNNIEVSNNEYTK